MISNHATGIISTSAIMLFSAIVVIISAGLLYRPDMQPVTIQAFTVSGQQLKAVVGVADLADDVFQLERLQNGIAVISSGSVHFSAQTFPYLSIHQTGLDSTITVDFFWRKRGQENTVQTQRLSNYGDATLTLHLAANPQWSDDIIEFGFSVEGQLKQALVIRALSFESWSISTWAAAIWDQWWSYGDWKGTSVNFISGGGYDKIKNSPAP
jgi:hypothetical protein